MKIQVDLMLEIDASRKCLNQSSEASRIFTSYETRFPTACRFANGSAFRR